MGEIPIPSWAQIAQASTEKKPADSSSDEDEFKAVIKKPRKGKSTELETFDPQKLVKDLFRRTSVKRVRSHESIPNATETSDKLVISRGLEEERNSSLAIVGDSQIPSTLRNKHWQNWTLANQCVIRCFPGGTVNKHLADRGALP